MKFHGNVFILFGNILLKKKTNRCEDINSVRRSIENQCLAIFRILKIVSKIGVRFFFLLIFYYFNLFLQYFANKTVQ